MRNKVLSWLVMVGALSASVLSAALAVPLIASARGGAPGRGGGGGGAPSVNGCKAKQPTRLRLQTTKRMHQPFLEYRGQIAGADGVHKYGWDVLIDRCQPAAKVATVSGVIPDFRCPDGSGAFGGYNSAMFSFVPSRELAIQGGRFHASGLDAGRGNPDTYSITGTVSGNVSIPKHGPGKGSSTITGKLTDEGFCSGYPMSYKVTFVRTWSHVGMGRGS